MNFQNKVGFKINFWNYSSVLGFSTKYNHWKETHLSSSRSRSINIHTFMCLLADITPSCWIYLSLHVWKAFLQQSAFDCNWADHVNTICIHFKEDNVCICTFEESMYILFCICVSLFSSSYIFPVHFSLKHQVHMHWISENTPNQIQRHIYSSFHL